MNPTPNTAEQSTLATVPLNLLRMDNDNVRGRTDDPASRQADAELAASIRAQGLLENLVVVPRGKTQYGVVAGGRRYRALKALVEIGAIPKDHPVPCLVVDRSRAAESSLAENVVRVAMHPVDQVVAFTRLADVGATTEQIADRFGLAERTVRKRLRLGRLPREILDAYRGGAINAAVAEAFAVTGDTNHQIQAFKSLSQSNSLHVRAVQQTIAQRQFRSDSPAALFVGLDAYRAAGGGIEEPLFEEGYVTVLDATLMTRLAEEKLQDTAARYAADWKWTATQLEFTWADRQQYTIAPAADRAEFTEEESAQRQQASDIIDATGEKLDNLDHDPERREELWAAIREAEERYEAIGRRRADRDEYLEAVRRVSGVIATLDEDGNIDMTRQDKMHLITWNCGPGMSTQTFELGAKTVMLATVTPITATRMKLCFNFTKRLDTPARFGPLVDGLIAEVVRQVEQDIPIWENKVFRETPILCDGDGPIAKYRRWFSQFYDGAPKTGRVTSPSRALFGRMSPALDQMREFWRLLANGAVACAREVSSAIVAVLGEMSGPRYAWLRLPPRREQAPRER